MARIVVESLMVYSVEVERGEKIECRRREDRASKERRWGVKRRLGIESIGGLEVEFRGRFCL
jgi:hypothetical protein